MRQRKRVPGGTSESVHKPEGRTGMSGFRAVVYLGAGMPCDEEACEWS